MNDHIAQIQEAPEDDHLVAFRPYGSPDGVKAVMSSSGKVVALRFDPEEFTLEQALRWTQEAGWKHKAFFPADDGPVRFDLKVKVTKLQEDERLVFGWGYLCKDPSAKFTPPDRLTDDGVVVDWSGEIIDIEDLERAVYKYVENCREGDVMHEGQATATLVESFVVTAEKKAILGLDDDFPEGVLLGFRVEDDAAWKAVKSGEFPMFSLTADCRRQEIP